MRVVLFEDIYTCIRLFAFTFVQFFLFGILAEIAPFSFDGLRFQFLISFFCFQYRQPDEEDPTDSYQRDHVVSSFSENLAAYTCIFVPKTHGVLNLLVQQAEKVSRLIERDVNKVTEDGKFAVFVASMVHPCFFISQHSTIVK